MTWHENASIDFWDYFRARRYKPCFPSLLKKLKDGYQDLFLMPYTDFTWGGDSPSVWVSPAHPAGHISHWPSSNAHADLPNSLLWRWDIGVPLQFSPHFPQPFQDLCVNTSYLSTAILILLSHSDLSITFYFPSTILYHTQTLLFCQSLLAPLWCKVLKHSPSIGAASTTSVSGQLFRQHNTPPMRSFSRTYRKYLILIPAM